MNRLLFLKKNNISYQTYKKYYYLKFEYAYFLIGHKYHFILLVKLKFNYIPSVNSLFTNQQTS